MDKFTIFKQNRKFMSGIGLFSDRLNEPTNDLLKSKNTYYILFFMTVYFISAAAYALKMLKVATSSDAIDFGYLFVGCFQAFGMYISVGLQMTKTKAMLLKLQTIVDEGSSNEVLDIYWKAELQCRQHTKKISCFLIFNQSVFWSLFFYSIYCIWIGTIYDMIAVNTKWPLTILLPFNVHTLSGWYSTLLFQQNIGLSYSLIMVTTTSFFVSCCLYIVAICDHFIYLTQSINEDVDLLKKMPNKKVELQERVAENSVKLIKVHTQSLEIFDIAAEINSGSIFFLLPSIALFTALAMYNLEHSTSSIALFLFYCFCLSLPLLWSSLFCYFATITTEKLGAIGDIAYAANWYDYTINLQKYVILMIVRSQEPSRFTGLGIVSCSLEVLGTILRSSCSYYLIFRRLFEY